MPTPYDYTVAQPNVSTYFDAMRQGRTDRLTAENDQKMNALAKYLPGALNGDEEARGMALQVAPVDQMAALKQTFAQMDAPKLAAVKEFRAQTAAGAYGIKDPTQWAAFQEQQRAEAQRLGIPFKEVPFEQKDSVIAMGRTVEQLISEEIERKKLALDASRTNAQNAASYASAEASRAATARAGMPPIDPNSGARVAPPGLQGRDSGELAKARASSDAAANIASTLMSAAPALSQIKTGAGTGLARNIAGVFSATGFFPSADEFTKNYDAIEQASKTIGIDTLQKVGGSDTERELLTAIQTTVNPDVQPQENMRRFNDQIAASDILAKKAQFMTEWVNKAGSLSYSLPNGMTWPQFWSEYQKAAWADHRKAMQSPPSQRNYRQEQRDLLNGKTTQGGPVPPPGFEIVK